MDKGSLANAVAAQFPDSLVTMELMLLLGSEGLCALSRTARMSRWWRMWLVQEFMDEGSLADAVAARFPGSFQLPLGRHSCWALKGCVAGQGREDELVCGDVARARVCGQG